MTVPDRSDTVAAGDDDETRALLDRLAAGESAAFETLFGRYFNRLRRYAYSYVRSWTEAEDLVHDVFLQLWRRHRWLGGVRDLDAYVYSVTRNLAINHVRRQGVEARWRAREAAAHAAAAEGAARLIEAERELAASERVAAILCAFDALPPRQREVMLLRWREGKTVEEVATALGITANTVEIHITRAHKQLRRLLSDLLP